MRRRMLHLAAVLALAGAAAALRAPPTAEAPPLGFTGGFGEPTCVSCHTGNAVNAFGGRVTLQGLPSRYAPGAAYLLTVVLEAEETAVAGFELSARYTAGASRGRNAGALAPVDARVVVADSAGVSYGHHNRAGSRALSPDRTSWSLMWTAPVGGGGGGPVTFSVAANSGNADNSPLSDLIYATEVIVPPAR